MYVATPSIEMYAYVLTFIQIVNNCLQMRPRKQRLVMVKQKYNIYYCAHVKSYYL